MIDILRWSNFGSLFSYKSKNIFWTKLLPREIKTMELFIYNQIYFAKLCFVMLISKTNFWDKLEKNKINEFYLQTYISLS